ncbi:MAG: alkaline phosphatase D family protein [Verrucomicrobiota bacterium]
MRSDIAKSLIGGLVVLLSVLGCGFSEEDRVISRVAFGSCNHQSVEQPMWDVIVERGPELFVFLGDNIYGDTEDMEVMQAKYDQLAAKPGYQALKAMCPILATWDDHDYGANDAGREYPMREESERVFLDFFEEPAGSERRRRPGVYDAVTFGPEGRRLQVILLDTRYFRSELPRNPKDEWPEKGRYSPMEYEGATILGDAQWEWLEEVLRERVDLRILASSIQVIPDEHEWEKWGNFPRDRERLLRLLRGSGPGAAPAVVISGDRHMGEISRMDGVDQAGPDLPLVEVTSSGLTESWRGDEKAEENRYRVSGDLYRLPNFGFLTINWGEPAGGMTVEAEIGNVKGEVVLRETVVFD